MPTCDPSEFPPAVAASQPPPAATVSVATCAYNVAPYIRAAVLSALQQTYPALEVIVIDDGSNDGTIERIKDIIDPRLYILSRPNRGHAASMNDAVSAAKGDYIAFLDADDLWRPEKLERHLDFHQAHPDIDMSFSGSTEIDVGGQTLGLLLSPGPRRIAFRDLLIENPVHNGSSSVIRVEALRRAGPFDTTFNACHDLDMWLRIARLREHNIYGFPEPLTYYRRRPQQTSANAERMETAWNQVIAKAALVAPDEVRATEAPRRVNLNRYLAYLSYEAGRFGSALRYLATAIRSSPIRFLADRRNTLLTAACLSGLLLPKAWHQALYRRLRDLYDRTALRRAARSPEF